MHDFKKTNKNLFSDPPKINVLNCPPAKQRQLQSLAIMVIISLFRKPNKTARADPNDAPHPLPPATI